MGFKIGLKMNLNYLFVKTLLMDGEFQRTVGTELQKRVWLPSAGIRGRLRVRRDVPTWQRVGSAEDTRRYVVRYFLAFPVDSFWRANVGERSRFRQPSVPLPRVEESQTLPRPYWDGPSFIRS